MKRYKIGDYLMHESAGVCQVKEIEELALSGKGSEKEYYELAPVYQAGGQVITPVEDKNGRLRDIKSGDEMQKILDAVDELDTIDEMNNRVFQEKVKSAMSDFEPLSLAGVVKTVYLRNKSRVASGKKAMSQDERVLQIAGKKLFDEMAFAMHVGQETVAQNFFACLDNVAK
jgi:CarD family transcriptional regulator